MDQINMFEEMYKELPIQKDTLKLGTFFSGIGSPEGSLKDIGIDYELQFFSEINKYAIKGYCAIHNESEEKCVGSISDLKGVDLPYCDMWFGGFPCQDISLAGNGKGFAMETDSRSSLGWEMIRLASEVKVKPRYIVFENVAAIFNNTHRPILNLFKQDLEKLGYTLYNKLLNAKDYGSPQNRNRYFLVAILGEYNYTFPSPIKLELRLKDLLEDNVDEKYYLRKELLKQLVLNGNDNCNPSGKGINGKVHSGDISPTITTNKGEGLKILEVGNLYKNKNFDNQQRGRVYDSNGISPSLMTVSGGGLEPKILIPEATKKGYSEAKDGDGIYIDRPHQKRGVVQKGMTPTIKTSGDDIGVVVKGVYLDQLSRGVMNEDKEGLSTTLKAQNGHNGVMEGLRIRKLTPLECYRLQAFTDEEFYRAESVISNSQLYKTSGNSINRNVLKHLFRNLLLGGSQ